MSPSFSLRMLYTKVCFRFRILSSNFCNQKTLFVLEIWFFIYIFLCHHEFVPLTKLVTFWNSILKVENSANLLLHVFFFFFFLTIYHVKHLLAPNYANNLMLILCFLSSELNVSKILINRLKFISNFLTHINSFSNIKFNIL